MFTSRDFRRTAAPWLFFALAAAAAAPAALAQQPTPARDSAAAAVARDTGAAAGAAAAAQAKSDTAARPTLSLEDALTLARQNSPTLQIARDREVDADWAAREAYAQLLPSADVSTSFQYQAAGTPQFGIISGADLGLSRTPAYYFSNYQLTLGYQLNGSRLFAPKQQRANQRAVEADVAVTEFQLVSDVTRQYMAVLRAQDGEALARQQLDEAQDNFTVAKARLDAGGATRIDVQQAEVAAGKARVTLLQAQNSVRAERLRLGQQIGVALPQDVELVSTFPVVDLPYTEQQLVDRALARHPALRAAEARQDAASAASTAAKTAYLPTFRMNVYWTGNTRQAADEQFVLAQAKASATNSINQCTLMNEISAGLSTPLPDHPADCQQFALSQEQEQQILAGNRQFPFHFSTQPLFAQFTVSIPIFGGLSRERQMEAARAAEHAAREQVREQELALRASVAAAYGTLETARQSVGIQKGSRDVADEQLKLERQRYAVGGSSFLQLQQAQTVKVTADRDYLDAVYAYHQALADLENAVGERLRP